MAPAKMNAVFCILLAVLLSKQLALSYDVNHVITWNHTPGDEVLLTNPGKVSPNEVKSEESIRDKRDVIEEETLYYPEKPKDFIEKSNSNNPWVPETIANDDDKAISTTSENIQQALPLYKITDAPTEKPGRGARSSNHDAWIKLPSPSRDEEEKDRLLTPPQFSDDLLNSRMPRVNFVTQNKRLDSLETRNERDSVSRATINRSDDLKTDFAHAGVDGRARNMKDVFPRQAVYSPEEDRRRYFYEDRSYPVEDMYRRDPSYDLYDRRYMDYVPYNPRPRIDRFDDNYLTRKPKRIIYYAHLPEVVRTPPSVDMRYKYSVDPYRRFDDDYTRSSRYDYRFKQRYPYSPLRKDDRPSRDLISSGTTKEKRTEEKNHTPPAVIQKDEVRSRNKNNLNSHQYHLDSSEVHYAEPLHKMYEDVVRSDQGYVRYDLPSFQAPIDDPYAKRQ